MMKRLIYIGFMVGLLVWPLAAFAADYAAQAGFSFQSWTSDADESGSQLIVPLVFQSDADHLSWHMNTGYANTLGEIQGGDEESVSGMLDTQVGATYLLSGGPLDWLLGLDVNVPTGQTGLEESKVRIMLDPDLVPIITPGQGLNINPTLSVAHQGDRFGVGLGVGYAFQGEYDYTEQIRKYDPGDVLKVAAETDYAITEHWQWGLQAQYLTMGEDKIDGDNYLNKGDTWLVGTSVNRAVDKWELELSLTAIFRGKAALADGTGSMITESRVSLGNEYWLDIASRHLLGPNTRFDINAQYMLLQENDYAESSNYYMGSRRKAALSLGLVQQLTKTLDLQCALGGFTMSDEPSWLHPGEDRQYQGWTVSAALVQHF